MQLNYIVVDKVVAVVNEEIITLTDVEKAILFYPFFLMRTKAEKTLHSDVLKELINYKVVYLEYRDNLFLIEEDFAEVQIQVIEKTGSLEKLMALLNRFNMDWSDFRKFITEKVLFEKVLKDQFKLEIVVSFQEINGFYNREYVPNQKRLGFEPKTLVEMAPFIENHLKRVKTTKELTEWLADLKSFYNIENKLQKEET